MAPGGQRKLHAPSPPLEAHKFLVQLMTSSIMQRKMDKLGSVTSEFCNMPFYESRTLSSVYLL